MIVHDVDFAGLAEKILIQHGGAIAPLEGDEPIPIGVHDCIAFDSGAVNVSPTVFSKKTGSPWSLN